MKILRDFKCSCCGLCCQHISRVLPEFDLGNGTCCHYDPETKLCKIYEDRPLICRVKELWQQKFSSDMSWKDWCKLNYEQCQKFQEEDNKH